VNPKTLLKTITPAWAFAARDRRRATRAGKRFAGMPTPDVFDSIYREGLWGQEPGEALSSGRGSRDAAIVGPYVAAVTAFLQELPERPRVVDLGCGDFNVGSRLRGAAESYVACDVATTVIERNREKFADADVDFRVLDMIREDLPAGDVVFVRQVFQHLDNAQISAVLPKLRAYTWAVITEHVPGDPTFVPNLDIIAGPGTRAQVRSGVVLTEPPFALRTPESRELCVVHHDEGTITTTAYRFR
jgi:SAM-dependent methyltransferase